MDYRPIGEVIFTEPLNGFAGYVERTRRASQAVDTSVWLGAPADEVYSDPEGSSRAAKDAIGSPTRIALDTAVEGGEDLDAAAVRVREASEKEQNIRSYADFILEEALTADNPAFNPMLARALTNQQLLVQMLQERIEEPSTGGKVLDFIDRYLIRYLPFGLWEDLTRSIERTGRDVAAKTLLPTNEFLEWAPSYIEKIATEGAFRNENWFALGEALDEATNAGYDPMASINQILGIAEVIPLLKGVGQLTRIGTLAGADAAARAARAAGRAGLDAEETILTEAMPSFLDPVAGDAVRPNYAMISRIAEDNALVQEIDGLTRAGTFGRVADEAEINAEAARISTNVEAISSRPISDMAILNIGLDNYAANFKIGRMKDGAPFMRETDANKFRNNLEANGLVARVEPADAGGGFYVVVEERLDLTTAAGPVETEAAFGIFRSGIARLLGSSAQVDDLTLNTLANQAESGFGALREIYQPYLKSINRLPFDSKMAIGQVFRDLRDGKDSFMRVSYTEEEFRRLYQSYHPKDKLPTENDINAFYALQTISDASYVLQANRIAHRYVSRGYKTIDTGIEHVPARIVDNVGRDTTVYDVSTSRYFLRSSLPDDIPIWHTDRPLEGGIEYVANPQGLRSIRYEDVMGYNAGGRRANPKANYFVVDEVSGRSLLTTFSTAQARIAVEQIGNIFDGVKQLGKKIDNLTDELDDLIARNNDWNPSMGNTADFVKLAAKKGWKVDNPVSFKKRDDIVESATDLFDGMTYDDLIKVKHHRSDDVLMDYGGQETFNYNPVKAIVDQLSSVSAQYSYQNYTYRSKAAWLKAAMNRTDLPEGISVNRLFNDYRPTGTKAQRLETLRNIIRRREFFKSNFVKAMEDYGQQLSEFVFDKTGAKMKLGDPTNVLLRLGFQSAFGFMNVFQFFLQASHAFTIMALSPIHGTQAAAMVLPLRVVLASNSKVAVERFAKAFGMKVEDAEELVRYIRTSGRDMVESDAIEKGTDPGFGVSGYEGQSYLPSVVRKTLYQTSKLAEKGAHIGTTPFREGERLSRLTGITTAFLEWKGKFKGASALSDDARTFITRREQDLSFNMTTGSRAAFQDGLMRVPTQWLSYSFRAMESVILGRGFSKAERARLAVFFAFQGGLAGMGFQAFTDDVAERLGVEPDSNTYAAIKYGMFDGILSYGLSELTDQEIRTAIGTRMAPLTALLDIKRKVTEDSTLAALGGPSSEIVFGGLAALADTVGMVYNGYGNSSKESIERFLRTPSGVDNIYKAMGMINDGIYESKTGRRVTGLEFSDIEGYLQGMGFTNFKVADYYSRGTESYRNSKDVKAFVKAVTNDYVKALEMEDDESRIEFLKEIDARIRLSGFTMYDQMQIRRSLRAGTNADTTMMFLNEMRRENPYGASVVDSYRLGDK